ncbi:hypothetical protein BGX29_005343, partial [Mortierella sp. GBA35]
HNTIYKAAASFNKRQQYKHKYQQEQLQLKRNDLLNSTTVIKMNLHQNQAKPDPGRDSPWPDR